MTRQQETTAGLTTADLISGQPADAGATQEETRTETDIRLMDDAESSSFQQRWSDVQSRFVDDPRAAVHEADTLVAEVMQSLARGFADHKAGLEDQWSRDDQPDTEQLRQALQRYRSFFSRLLAT
jgi:replication fork clamp-binding protein CrfC